MVQSWPLFATRLGAQSLLAAYHTLLVAGAEMAGSVIAGAAIGHWVDTRWLEYSGWRGAATVAGIALGFALGVRLLLQLLARAQADESGE